ncbi:bll1565 [Bradyrhizobium diazoefficiens USDA 110]|uniref:Bll1565 protein n=1 Tax=Bradyrhizobium diazoefficiens (strain JCM 10833 / BCRC 13528 / IAM 13628 / NBRC 14792 / USDA 110) TaxID=224911 RepID=Q89U54_BRADU|nr:hypothetical protein [Bradyrhizobium japonicum]QBP20495.1 hypothetical protein Bdiaspc4_07910 [Bradyrhizobium diazoefficiens]BAC46830.1 bll1565 [Bradyrhizobium diazoefficiens USDA 110]
MDQRRNGVPELNRSKAHLRLRSTLLFLRTSYLARASEALQKHPILGRVRTSRTRLSAASTDKPNSCFEFRLCATPWSIGALCLPIIATHEAAAPPQTPIRSTSLHRSRNSARG